MCDRPGPVGVISATDQFDDQTLGLANEMVLDFESDNLFAGEIKLMKKTLAMRAHKDEYLDLYDASIVLLGENEEKLASDGFLLKYDGKGDGDWHGPQGTDYLAIISGSLQKWSARFVLTGEAYKILKSYGVVNRYFLNLYEIEPPVVKAIKEGKLQKGELIAMGIVLGCSLTK